MWSSSTSPVYLFLFPFLSCKLSCPTTEVCHLFSAFYTCFLSIQSPDLHHNFSHIFISVFSLFGTVTWLFPSQPCHLIHFLLFLPLPPLSSPRFVRAMFVSRYSVLILIQGSFQITLLPPALQWNCVFAITFS